MKIDFPTATNFQIAKRVLQTIEQHGYEAYIVGGAVRDALLHRQVSDIDIATSAAPDQIMQLFSKTVPTGIAHGTISVNESGHWFEVTTYREDGPYDDGRHPRFVHFDTTLFGDLSRRDFTVNAMAMDQSGFIQDPFHGFDDLMAKTIRAVGDAKARFQEDGLRVARAFRFSAALGFSIAESTMIALSSSSANLEKVAAERRQEEWNKFIVALNASFCERIPDAIVSAWTGWEDFAFSLYCQKVANVDELHHRLALIFLLTGASSLQIETMMRVLRYSRKSMDEVRTLVQATREWSSKSPPRMNLFLGKAITNYGEKIIEDAALLSAIQTSSSLESELSAVSKWLSEHPLRTLKDLDIEGSNLIRELSLQGQVVGRMLEHLFDLAANGQIRNTYEALLQEANDWLMNAAISESIIRQMLQNAPKNLVIYEYQEISSTNDVAKEKIVADRVPMLVVFSDRQASGRGRQGRAWVSPAGKSLALSIAFRLHAKDLHRLQEWPLFAALTVRLTLSRLGIQDVMIKWPNDIFIKGKKVCGILTEMRSVGTDVHLIIGIGINVNADLNDFPDEIQSKVTSLKIMHQQSISMNWLTARLIDDFYELMLWFQANMKFSDRKEEYERYCITLGQKVQARQGHVMIQGTAQRIDDEGTLWMMDDQGAVFPIRSGEIIENGDEGV